MWFGQRVFQIRSKKSLNKSKRNIGLLQKVGGVPALNLSVSWYKQPLLIHPQSSACEEVALTCATLKRTMDFPNV